MARSLEFLEVDLNEGSPRAVARYPVPENVVRSGLALSSEASPTVIVRSGPGDPSLGARAAARERDDHTAGHRRSTSCCGIHLRGEARVSVLGESAAEPGAASPDDVRDNIRERLLEALGDRACAVFLHGSRAKGTAHGGSDWDIAVVLRDPVEDWVAESLRLSGLFYECPYSVDLQVFGADEFKVDAGDPGTLPYAIVRRGECLCGQS